MTIREIARSTDDKSVVISVSEGRKPIEGIWATSFRLTGLNKIVAVLEVKAGVYEITAKDELRKHRLYTYNLENNAELTL